MAARLFAVHNNSMEENRPPSKKDPVIIGIILIGIGLLFIVGRFLDFGGMGKLWPLFMFIPVIALITTLIKDPRKNAGTLIPITILIFLGVYFLWLNYSSWDRVVYTWPNFILAPGLGILASWLITRDRGQLISASVILIVGFLMYGRILMTRIGLHIDRFLMLGILLILGGVIMLITRKKKKD